MEVDDLYFSQTSACVTVLPVTYIVFLRRNRLRGCVELCCHVDSGLERDCGSCDNDLATLFGSLEVLSP
jgi:hypothetical protein